MSEGGMQMTSQIMNRVLVQGGICTAIFGALSIAAAFSSKIHFGFFGYVALFVSGSVLTTIGVVVGDLLRRMAMPDMYFTKGFGDSIKKRIFWAIGPQAIGWFLGFVATNGFMENYLGYDMKTGRGRVAAVAPQEQAKVDTALSSSASSPAAIPVERSTQAPAAPQSVLPVQAFQLIEVGACVMGLSKSTANGAEFVRPILVYRQGGDVEPIGTMQTFSAFYAEEQHSVTGRVRLMYAPGVFDDEPKSGEVLGWVNAADLQVYDQRNCQ